MDQSSPAETTADTVLDRLDPSAIVFEPFLDELHDPDDVAFDESFSIALPHVLDSCIDPFASSDPSKHWPSKILSERGEGTRKRYLVLREPEATSWETRKQLTDDDGSACEALLHWEQEQAREREDRRVKKRAANAPLTAASMAAADAGAGSDFFGDCDRCKRHGTECDGGEVCAYCRIGGFPCERASKKPKPEVLSSAPVPARCQNCRAGHRKCDRQVPCSECKARGATCIPSPAPEVKQQSAAPRPVIELPLEEGVPCESCRKSHRRCDRKSPCTSCKVRGCKCSYAGHATSAEATAAAAAAAAARVMGEAM